MPSLAGNINSLLARRERVSIDGQKTIWKLNAINSIVSLINGVYFLVWSILTHYNGVHFVQYKGPAWVYDSAGEVIERNGLFYSEDVSAGPLKFDSLFSVAQWYGILVSLSHSWLLAAHMKDQ